MKKIDLVAFSEYKTGGVQTFYYNLLSHQDNFFAKKWILISLENNTDPLPPKDIISLPHSVFYDLNSLSKYRKALRLKKLIPNFRNEGVIIVNHPTELNYLEGFTPPRKTIYFICHDILYLDFAKRFQSVIDVFIAHNRDFYEQLKQILPDRINDIYYLPFGIKFGNKRRNTAIKKSELKIAFLARLQKSKGIYDVATVDEILSDKNVSVNWIIMGKGPEEEQFKDLVKARKNFKFEAPENHDRLFEELKQCDVFILPSYLDGTPLSLLESMSVGLVPIVYEFNKGVNEIIGENNGFVVPLGDKNVLAEKIMYLDSNREVLEELSNKTSSHVRLNYNAEKCFKAYYDLFREYKKHYRPKKSKPLKPSGFLDHRLIPYKLASLIRSFRR